MLNRLSYSSPTSPSEDENNGTAPAIAIQEQLIPIPSIVREPAFMMRVALNDATVKKYAAAMAAGALFPPIDIVEVDKRLLLTGGFHRTAAMELNGGSAILAHVRPGTMEQAILAAARAGAHEGLKRTNEDKHKVVEALLAIEWGKTNSDHMVAEAAGVSQPFVTKLRHRSTDNGYQLPPMRKGKDGKIRSAKRRKSGSATPPESPIQASSDSANIAPDAPNHASSDAEGRPGGDRGADSTKTGNAGAADAEPAATAAARKVAYAAFEVAECAVEQTEAAPSKTKQIEKPRPKRALAPKDEALFAFTAHVLDLVQRIGKHKPARFAETAVEVHDLAELGKFFTDLATLKSESPPDQPTPEMKDAIVLEKGIAETTAGAAEGQPDEVGDETTDECDEPEPELKPRRRLKSIEYNTTLNEALDCAFADLEDLAAQCRERVDNASEGLQATQRIQTFETSADELENLDMPAVPDALLKMPVKYSLPKRRYMSRAARASDDTAILEGCVQALESIPDDADGHADAQTLISELRSAIDTVEMCEFPGMYQ
jgi:hypothetical protein